MGKLKNITSKDVSSLDNVCVLLKASVSTDEYGWQEETFDETLCYCAEAPVTLSEFYKAGHEGIKLEKVLIVDSESYNNETYVRYEDEEFSVVRIYIMPNGMTELHLSLKVGNYDDQD